MLTRDPVLAYTIDVAGAIAVLSSLLGWVSPLAALIAVIWYVIQIWESRTIQAWVQKRHERKIIRLAAKLAALQLRSSANAASMELKGAAEAAAQTLRAEAKAAIGTAVEVKKAGVPPYDHEA